MTHKKSVGLLFVLMLCAPGARAQETQDPSANAKVKIGPLALSPSIDLVNAGVDNNVFNDPDSAQPKSDFTMTLEPKTDVWLHMGRSLLSGNVTEDLVYYKQYANQRSANNKYSVGLLVPLTRIAFKGDASYYNAKDRPGFEIDARVQHTDVAYDGSVELRMLSKTFIGVKASHLNVAYDQTSEFLGTNLQNELNRNIISQAVTLRHQLTPLTSITIDAGKEQDRFDIDHLRDSDSTNVTVGLAFDPFALLKGSAKVGYRDFKPLSAALPAFRGSTAAVDLSYVLMGSTKFAVSVLRDVQYSYDINNPYYIQTGGTLSITQQLFGPVDVVGRVGIARLDYQTLVTAVVSNPNRSDYIHSYGGGIGYHMGKDVRVGFNLDDQKRTSAIDSRQYDDLRFGAAVTYGF